MRISDWSSDVCSSDLPSLHWGGLRRVSRGDSGAAAPAGAAGWTMLLAQARKAVFVAFLGHRVVVDLLPQVALGGSLLDRFAACRAPGVGVGAAGAGGVAGASSEVRRVGKECVSPGRTRWSTVH